MKNRIAALFNRVSVCIVILTFSIVLTSCDLGRNNDFPDISYTISSAMSVDDTGEKERVINSGIIRIALPFPEECLKYLVYMYVGETGGLFRKTHSSLNGLSVSLGILENYNIGLTTELVAVPDRGFSTEQIYGMKSAGNLPDIFLANSYSSVEHSHFDFADLSGDYLNDYLKVSNVFPEMYASNGFSGEISSLPLYSSLMLLYANMGLLSSELSDTAVITSPITLQTLKAITEEITDPETGVAGFYGIRNMVAFLPSAVDPFPGSYLWNRGKFDFRNSAFNDTIVSLIELVDTGGVLDPLSPEEVFSKYSTDDPRKSGKIAFWLDDSGDLTEWNDSFDFRLLPIPVVDRVSIPMHVYPVCVDPDSNILREAKELAVYLTMDRDALLFRSRYDVKTGYIPPLDDQLVWDELVAVQECGEDLIIIRDMLSGARILDLSAPADIENIFDMLYEEHFYDIIFNKEPFEEHISAIDEVTGYTITGG